MKTESSKQLPLKDLAAKKNATGGTSQNERIALNHNETLVSDDRA